MSRALSGIAEPRRGLENKERALYTLAIPNPHPRGCRSERCIPLAPPRTGTGRARKWVKGLVPCGLLGQSPDFSASITGETYRIIKRKSRIVPTRDFLPIQFCFGFIRSVKGCPTAYRTTSLPLDLTCATNCCPIIGFLILFNIFAPKVH